ncbi:MAG: ribbon-helix-helix domain-containing protein [Lachnospiraceae bacterium]|nr:ribbon-helix-helix domain-containing protein [Lachnospiraceae bacterium]
MPTDKPRFSLTVDEETLELIDNFRYENRYPTRSEAIIALVRMGLEKSSDGVNKNKE